MNLELIIGLAVPSVGIVLMYNSLVAKKNEIENATGAVHAYLKERADLVPSLVATVKQYMEYESGVLKDLTEARVAAHGGGGGQLQKSDAMMTKALGQVIAVAENYPDLKANQNFVQLQGALNEIEGQLSAARRTYNAAVVRYNTAVESFPSVIVASVLGWQRKPVFQVDEVTARKPDIESLFKKAS